MLSRGKRSNSRKNKKSKVSVIGEGTFLGLQFAHYLEEIKDSSEVVTVNPDVTFVNDTVIFDYSRATSKDNIDEIKVFFENTVSAGDTITVTGGEYTNPLTGDAKVYDIGGTYTFTKFDTNNFLVFLTKSSINNESSTYSKYESRYFIKESVQWTTESVTTNTIEINEILNLFGTSSLNCFTKVFGEAPQKGDILHMQLDKEDISTFTVLGFYVDDENQEHIIVEEELPEYGTTKVGEELFVRLSRTELIKKSRGSADDLKLCAVNIGGCSIDLLSCDNTCGGWRDEKGHIIDGGGNNVVPIQFGHSPGDCLSVITLAHDIPCGENKEGTRSEYVIGRLSDGERWIVHSPCCGDGSVGNVQDPGADERNYPTPPPPKPTTKTTTTSTQPSGNVTNRAANNNRPVSNTESPETRRLNIAYTQWLQSGKKTYNVTVGRLKQPNGSHKNVFLIDGHSRKTINVSPGQTIRIKQTDISNLESGYTNSHHPFKISTTRDGTHSGGEDSTSYYVNKGTLGKTRNPYVYITVRSNLFYYCGNHSGMGGEIKVSTENISQRGHHGCRDKCWQRIKGEDCWAEVPKGCGGVCGYGPNETPPANHPYEYKCQNADPSTSSKCSYIPEGSTKISPCLDVRMYARTPCGSPCYDDNGDVIDKCFVCLCGHEDASDFCTSYLVGNNCRNIPEKYHGDGYHAGTKCCDGDCGSATTRRQTPTETQRSSRTPSPSTTPPPSMPSGGGGGYSSGY